MIWIVSHGHLKANSSRFSTPWKLSNRDRFVSDSAVTLMWSSAVSKNFPLNWPAIRKKSSRLMIISAWPSLDSLLTPECSASICAINLSTTNSHTVTISPSTDLSSRLLKVSVSLSRISGENSKSFQETLRSWSPCGWS